MELGGGVYVSGFERCSLGNGLGRQWGTAYGTGGFKASGLQGFHSTRRRPHHPVISAQIAPLAVHHHRRGQHESTLKPALVEHQQPRRHAHVVVLHVVGDVAEVDTQAHLARLMTHRIHTHQRPSPRVGIASIGPHVVHVRAEVGGTYGVRRRIEIVEHRDRDAALHQFVHDMRADEPCTPGDQDMGGGAQHLQRLRQGLVSRELILSGAEHDPGLSSKQPVGGQASHHLHIVGRVNVSQARQRSHRQAQTTEALELGGPGVGFAHRHPGEHVADRSSQPDSPIPTIVSWTEGGIMGGEGVEPSAEQFGCHLRGVHGHQKRWSADIVEGLGQALRQPTATLRKHLEPVPPPGGPLRANRRMALIEHQYPPLTIREEHCIQRVRQRRRGQVGSLLGGAWGTQPGLGEAGMRSLGQDDDVPTTHHR